MKIYGDVLAAVNFTVTLLILQLCGRILGIRPGRAVKYISGALGAAAAFIIFVPIHSVAVQLFISVGSFGTVGRGSFSSTESQTAAAGHRGVLFGEYRFCWCDNVAHLAAAWIGLLYL